MTKKDKSKQVKSSKRLSLLLKLAILMAIIIGAVLVYNFTIRALDRQKFMSLKADILALQTEFNKIDPGWEYSEGCNANGAKFKQDEASSCSVEIVNKNELNIDRYLDIIRPKGSFTIVKTDYFNDKNKKYISVITNNKTYPSANCYMAGENKDGNIALGLNMGCIDSALDFYFPKTQ